MKAVLDTFSVAFKVILKDPINLLLSIFPTVIALSLYLLTIVTIYRRSDQFVTLFRGYIYTSDQATLMAKILNGILIVFVFFIMSWTFVIIVGVIAAPFNSMLSSRIEKRLTQNLIDTDKNQTLEKIGKGIRQTFINEFKKLFFLLIVAIVAFIMNLFPIFYPFGVFLVSILLAVQFIDYSWSRHDMHFSACLKDIMINVIPYSISGFVFLMLVAIPLVNAFIPAYATSYFTVLWLRRQKKLIE